MNPRKALVVIEVIIDFLDGGALGVPGSKKVIPPINRLITFLINNGLVAANMFENPNDEWIIIVTRDAHDDVTSPHIIKWGKHSMVNTPGFEFPKELIVPKAAHILHKGMGHRDAYSAFDEGAEIDGKPITLAKFLRAMNVEEVYSTGIATDWCVKATDLDGLKEGFKIYVLTDCVSALNMNPGDGEKALEELQNAGAVLTTTDEVIQSLEKMN